MRTLSLLVLGFLLSASALLLTGCNSTDYPHSLRGDGGNAPIVNDKGRIIDYGGNYRATNSTNFPGTNYR